MIAILVSTFMSISMSVSMSIAPTATIAFSMYIYKL